MSGQLQLIPELQELIDDFISVRQRFADFAKTYVAQKILLQKQQTELQNARQQLSAMSQKQIEHEAIVKSYNELKLDYEILHSASEKQREEVGAENKIRVRDLEGSLKAARIKYLEQADSNQIRVTQIVADYEAKLRNADEKIRQLSVSKHYTPMGNVVDNGENSPAAFIRGTKAPRGGNKRWPKLNVAIESSRASATRGRGRSRGAPSKRKLFKQADNNEKPIDLE